MSYRYKYLKYKEKYEMKKHMRFMIGGMDGCKIGEEGNEKIPPGLENNSNASFMIASTQILLRMKDIVNFLINNKSLYENNQPYFYLTTSGTPVTSINHEGKQQIDSYTDTFIPKPLGDFMFKYVNLLDKMLVGSVNKFESDRIIPLEDDKKDILNDKTTLEDILRSRSVIIKEGENNEGNPEDFLEGIFKIMQLSCSPYINLSVVDKKISKMCYNKLKNAELHINDQRRSLEIYRKHDITHRDPPNLDRVNSSYEELNIYPFTDPLVLRSNNQKKTKIGEKEVSGKTVDIEDIEDNFYRYKKYVLVNAKFISLQPGRVKTRKIIDLYHFEFVKAPKEELRGYTLCGILCKLKSTPHYISYIKHDVQNEKGTEKVWYLYDDNIQEKIGDDDTMFKRITVDQTIYLLLYECIETFPYENDYIDTTDINIGKRIQLLSKNLCDEYYTIDVSMAKYKNYSNIWKSLDNKISTNAENYFRDFIDVGRQIFYDYFKIIMSARRLTDLYERIGHMSALYNKKSDNIESYKYNYLINNSISSKYYYNQIFYDIFQPINQYKTDITTTLFSARNTLMTAGMAMITSATKIIEDLLKLTDKHETIASAYDVYTDKKLLDLPNPSDLTDPVNTNNPIDPNDLIEPINQKLLFDPIIINLNKIKKIHDQLCHHTLTYISIKELVNVISGPTLLKKVKGSIDKVDNTIKKINFGSIIEKSAERLKINVGIILNELNELNNKLKKKEIDDNATVENVLLLKKKLNRANEVADFILTSYFPFFFDSRLIKEIFNIKNNIYKGQMYEPGIDLIELDIDLSEFISVGGVSGPGSSSSGSSGDAMISHGDASGALKAADASADIVASTPAVTDEDKLAAVVQASETIEEAITRMTSLLDNARDEDSGIKVTTEKIMNDIKALQQLKSDAGSVSIDDIISHKALAIAKNSEIQSSPEPSNSQIMAIHSSISGVDALVVKAGTELSAGSALDPNLDTVKDSTKAVSDGKAKITLMKNDVDGYVSAVNAKIASVANFKTTASTLLSEINDELNKIPKARIDAIIVSYGKINGDVSKLKNEITDIKNDNSKAIGTLDGILGKINTEITDAKAKSTEEAYKHISVVEGFINQTKDNTKVSDFKDVDDAKKARRDTLVEEVNEADRLLSELETKIGTITDASLSGYKSDIASNISDIAQLIVDVDAQKTEYTSRKDRASGKLDEIKNAVIACAQRDAPIQQRLFDAEVLKFTPVKEEVNKYKEQIDKIFQRINTINTELTKTPGGLAEQVTAKISAIDSGTDMDKNKEELIELKKQINNFWEETNNKTTTDLPASKRDFDAEFLNLDSIYQELKKYFESIEKIRNTIVPLATTVDPTVDGIFNIVNSAYTGYKSDYDLYVKNYNTPGDSEYVPDKITTLHGSINTLIKTSPNGLIPKIDAKIGNYYWTYVNTHIKYIRDPADGSGWAKTVEDVNTFIDAKNVDFDNELAKPVNVNTLPTAVKTWTDLSAYTDANYQTMFDELVILNDYYQKSKKEYEKIKNPDGTDLIKKIEDEEKIIRELDPTLIPTYDSDGITPLAPKLTQIKTDADTLNKTAKSHGSNLESKYKDIEKKYTDAKKEVEETVEKIKNLIIDGLKDIDKKADSEPKKVEDEIPKVNAQIELVAKILIDIKTLGSQITQNVPEINTRLTEIEPKINTEINNLYVEGLGLKNKKDKIIAIDNVIKSISSKVPEMKAFYTKIKGVPDAISKKQNDGTTDFFAMAQAVITSAQSVGSTSKATIEGLKLEKERLLNIQTKIKDIASASKMVGGGLVISESKVNLAIGKIVNAQERFTALLKESNDAKNNAIIEINKAQMNIEYSKILFLKATIQINHLKYQAGEVDADEASKEVDDVYKEIVKLKDNTQTPIVSEAIANETVKKVDAEVKKIAGLGTKLTDAETMITDAVNDNTTINLIITKIINDVEKIDPTSFAKDSYASDINLFPTYEKLTNTQSQIATIQAQIVPLAKPEYVATKLRTTPATISTEQTNATNNILTNLAVWAYNVVLSNRKESAKKYGEVQGLVAESKKRKGESVIIQNESFNDVIEADKAKKGNNFSEVSKYEKKLAQAVIDIDTILKKIEKNKKDAESKKNEIQLNVDIAQTHYNLTKDVIDYGITDPKAVQAEFKAGTDLKLTKDNNTAADTKYSEIDPLINQIKKFLPNIQKAHQKVLSWIPSTKKDKHIRQESSISKTQRYLEMVRLYRMAHQQY